MKREVDVPLAGARAERGDGEPKGCLWFRGECSDTVKVAVPVELAAVVATRGAKVRLVVEVEPEREQESAADQAKVAGPWEPSPGRRWVRRVDYRVVAEVSPRGFGRHEVDWSAQDGSGMSRGFAGTALAVQQAQDAADEILRANGWVLR